MEKSPKVIIVGAGLAGLACARTLHEGNIDFLLMETSDRTGGRIKTDDHEGGFKLDRGFQVLLNSYPELPRFFNLDHLNLQKFGSGAKIFDGKQVRLVANPFQHPLHLIESLRSPVASLKDKLKVLTLVAHAFTSRASGKPQSTLDFLRSFGFSPPFIEEFWRPFFSGVFLDPELSVDSDFFFFLLRCFSLGSVSLPEAGMEALPKELTSCLPPEKILLSRPVDELTAHSGIMVQAYQRDLANSRSVVTYYFSTSEKVDLGKWLVLVPPHLQLHLNHLVVLSEVSKSYAPKGQSLISATSLRQGIAPSLQSIMNEIELIADRKLSLQHLKTDTIPHALPPYFRDAPGYLRREPQIYECGDHLSTPSINGALFSGRMVAEAILREVRK